MILRLIAQPHLCVEFLCQSQGIFEKRVELKLANSQLRVTGSLRKLRWHSDNLDYLTAGIQVRWSDTQDQSLVHDGLGIQTIHAIKVRRLTVIVQARKCICAEIVIPG